MWPLGVTGSCHEGKERKVDVLRRKRSDQRRRVRVFCAMRVHVCLCVCVCVCACIDNRIKGLETVKITGFIRISRYRKLHDCVRSS